ncbi:hypothetical protein GCM10008927_21170 [Amylibacter ulvae]|uniref:DUF726 domain-containing protein n=1 Tax=Paramylibacter ulvae TaxID=1651968 RepID=A0ABQ3D4G0_9RHOB|nr:alpha/beta hydrolase [Amylibacter ulvae]GHA55080.1 hypothetical protein GCM10008927_21170 [Amylibacter ulvae]
MSVFRVNSLDGRLFHPDLPARDVATLLGENLKSVPDDAPIIIMVHGYKFSPLAHANNPHRTIFARHVDRKHWKIRSWPRQMGVAQYDNRGGLAIGFAWHARSDSFLARTAVHQVYDRAETEGAQLARLINLLHDIAPNRKIDIMAHSMGARVVLQSLRHIFHQNLGRVVMMGGAEFGAVALAALQYPAARAAKFYNITARQNDFYDLLFERFAPSPGPANRALGMDFPFRRSNWVNIQIDCPKVLQNLRMMGIRMAHPTAGFCHWSFYTRDGVFGLYHAIFRREAGFTPAELTHRLGNVDQPRKVGAVFNLSYISFTWLRGLSYRRRAGL